MKNGMLGSDPDELDALGKTFDHAAASLREQRERIGRAIEGVTWEGADASSFRASWSANGARQIERAALLLEGNAETLRRKAQQQRQTSSAGGGSSPSGAMPTPGVVGPAPADEPELEYLDPRTLMRTPDVHGRSIPGLRNDEPLPRMEDEHGPPMAFPYLPIEGQRPLDLEWGPPRDVFLRDAFPMDPTEGPGSFEGIRMDPPSESIQIGPFPPPAEGPVDPGFAVLELDGPPLENFEPAESYRSKPPGHEGS